MIDECFLVRRHVESVDHLIVAVRPLLWHVVVERNDPDFAAAIRYRVEQKCAFVVRPLDTLVLMSAAASIAPIRAMLNRRISYARPRSRSYEMPS